ncbi:hypothetical protein Droror1_Dr00022728 [Drosera rotundifolia]
MRKPCCKKGAWSKQEDQKLIDYISKHGEGCWRSIPQAAGMRITLIMLTCASYSFIDSYCIYLHVLEFESSVLVLACCSSYVHQFDKFQLSLAIMALVRIIHTNMRFTSIHSRAPYMYIADFLYISGLLRCGKSCRLRWMNYLRPNLKRGNFGEDEEDLIIKLHALLGNRWSLIAGRLPGRTDNEVKNYWNSHLREKLISLGIDPSNHRLNQRRQDLKTITTSMNKESTTHSSPFPNHVSRSINDQAEQVGDEGSCLEDHDSSSLPDLNLELTMSITPSMPFDHRVPSQRHLKDLTISV